MTDDGEKKVKPKRPLRRRLLRWFLILVVVLVVVRAALPFVLPWALDRVAAGYDLSLTYDDLKLSILGGEVEMTNLVVAPREGGDPILELGWARVDLAVRELLSGDVQLDRVDLDRLDARLTIDETGEFAIAKRFASDEAPEEKPEEDEESEGGGAFRIDGLQARHLTLYLRDESVDPPIDLILNLGAGVRRLGFEGEEGGVKLTLSGERCLSSLDLTAAIRTTDGGLDATVDCALFGLKPEHIEPWLRAAGIRPVAGEIDLRFAAGIEQVGTGTKLFLEKLDLRGDGRTQAALGRVTASIEQPEDGSTVVEDVEVAGGSWLGEMRPDGAFRTLGFDFLPSGAPPEEAAPAEPEESGALRIGRVAIANLRGSLTDSTLTPPLTTTVLLKQIEVRDLATDAKEPGTIDAEISVPGTVKSIRIHGTAAPLAENKSFSLHVDLSDVTPAPHEPYLRAAGILPDFERGNLAFKVAGDLEPDRASLTLSNLGLVVGEDRQGIATVSIRDLRTADDGMRIGHVDLGGLDLLIERDTGGTLHAFGFRFPPPPPGEARTEPATPSGPTEPMRIEIGGVDLRENRIAFRDEAVDPAVDVVLEDLGLKTGKIAIGADEEGEPVELILSARAPGILDRLKLSGRITSGSRETVADLELLVGGFEPEGIAAWTEGLDFTYDRGDLELGISARVAPVESGGMDAELTVSDVAFNADDSSTFRLKSLAVSDIRAREGGTSIGRIDITAPDLPVQRDSEGVLHLLGLRFAPGPPETTPAASPAPAAEADEDPPGRLSIGAVSLTDFGIHLTDTSRGVARQQSLLVGLSTGKITAGTSNAIQELRLEVRVPDTETRIGITGELVSGNDGFAAELAILGRGLRAGPLDAILPPGLSIETKDGRLDARLEAGSGPHPDGGKEAFVVLRDLAVVDGEGSLFSVKTIAAMFDRLDPDGGAIDIAELAVRGIDGEVRLGTDGTTRLAGIALSPVEAKTGKAAPPVEEAARPAARVRKHLPLVTIETLDLSVARFEVIDETPGATPLVLEETHLWNPTPIRVLGEDPGAHGPVEVSLKASLRPLVDQVAVHTRLVPFSDPRSAEILLDVRGVSGPALTKAFPALAEKLDATELNDGRLAGKIDARLTTKLRGPLDFAFKREIGSAIEVSEFEIRNGIEGPPLFEFDHLDAKSRYLTETGDIHVQSLELGGLRGGVTMEPDGLRVLGLLVKNPPAEVETGEVGSAGDDQVPAKRDPIVTVDNLYVSDMEFRIVDRSVTPVMDFPLIGLDFELREFTTLTLTEKKPFQFQLVTRAGNVKLPTDEEDPPRPALDEIVVAGTLALGPEPLGSIRVSVAGLELSNLRGPVARSGPTLSDGVLDLGLKIAFPGAGDMDVSSEIALRDLSLSDSEDGLIMSALKLPSWIADLDSVLFLLRDHAGVIDFSVNLHADRGELGIGQIVTLALTQLSFLIVEAGLQSPLRVGAGVASIFGFGPDDPEAEEPVGLPFVPGDATLTKEGEEVLAGIIERMKDEDDLLLMVIHELGKADIEPVSRRSNPSAEQCRALAAAGRLRRRELLTDRSVAEEEARAALAANRPDAARTARQKLRAIDRELGALDRSLDQVLAILKTGTEKRRERRMRQGCLTLGRMRMEEAWRRLLDAGIEDVEGRVRFRRPRYRDPEEEGGGRVSIRPSHRVESD